MTPRPSHVAPVIEPNRSPRAIAAYSADMARQLADMNRRAGLRTLAMLFEMAHLEAAGDAERKP